MRHRFAVWLLRLAAWIDPPPPRTDLELLRAFTTDVLGMP